MVSINSTASNSAVLASLRQTNKDITATQTRIGTGLKINGASDGAAAWAMAQSIRSDIQYQSTLGGSISVAKTQVDAGVAGLDQINKLLGKIRDLGSNPGSVGANPADANVINQVKSIKTQIIAIIKASGFEGKNFLVDSTAVDVKIGKDVAAVLSISPSDVAGSASFDALFDAIDAVTTNTELGALLNLSNTAITYATGHQNNLSSFSASLESQVDFLNTLDAIKKSALSSIVDADMEKESANIAALQVKQQLAFQALSIGNSSAQNILRLFQ